MRFWRQRPEHLQARHPVTGLYPFMLAAVGDRRSLMGDRVDVGLVYILLRRDPSVIHTFSSRLVIQLDGIQNFILHTIITI